MDIAKPFIIFTDLDGTLLDHYSYSAEPALGCLDQLEQHNIPVIFTSSKTAAEIIEIRQTLKNRHPFIVENGAAIYIPKAYFDKDAKGQPCDYNNLERITFCRDRKYWQDCLNKLDKQFGHNFTSFEQLGHEGITKLTGLDTDSSILANTREFSEPVYWKGSDNDKQAFLKALSPMGAKVLEGGRFLHISGDCCKSAAMHELSLLYKEQFNNQPVVIAAGDSPNDIDMLDKADISIIIRSPAREPITLSKTEHVYLSRKTGPTGWAETMNQITELP